MLTRQEVLHIAHLARIHLTEEEITLFQRDLSSILDWVSVLQEVDTENVPETSQVTGLQNVTRKGDEISVYGKEKELLAQSPNEIMDHQIRIPNIMD